MLELGPEPAHETAWDLRLDHLLEIEDEIEVGDHCDFDLGKRGLTLEGKFSFKIIKH